MTHPGLRYRICEVLVANNLIWAQLGEEQALKVVEVRTIPMNYKEQRYERDALAVKAGAEHPMDVLLIEVETDDGIVGLGEIYAYSAVPLMEEVVRTQIAPLVLGEDPMNTGAIWHKIYRATFRHGRRGAVICGLSGMDIALWDIVGKAAGLPVATLLGGGRKTLPTYVTGGYYAADKDLEQLRSEVATVRAAGFKGFKLKIGGATLAEDAMRLQVTRDAGGDDLILGVDANCALSYTEALALGRVLEEYHVTFFEEPISSDQPELSARLAADLDVPIAGYETALTRWEMLPFIKGGGVDIVQTDAIWTGGLSEARRIAELAAAFGLEYIPHFSAGAVALTANLQLAAAMPNALYQEFHLRPNPLRDQLLVQAPVVRDGELIVPQGPGLGIELNPDTVSKYRVGPGIRVRA